MGSPPRRLVASVFVALVLLASGGPIAAANWPPETEPVLVGMMNGPGWVLLDVAPSGYSEVSVVADRAGDQVVAAVFLFRMTSGEQISSLTTMTTDGGVFVAASTGDSEESAVGFRALPGGRFAIESGHGLDEVPVRVLLWTAGEVSRTDYRVGSTEPEATSVIVVGSGDRTHLSYGEDFAGSASVVAHAGHVEIVAQPPAVKQVNAQGTLVGIFGSQGLLPPLLVHEEVNMTTPRAAMDCPCTFGEVGSLSHGPGTYTFQRSAVGVRPLALPVLAYADVTF